MNKHYDKVKENRQKGIKYVKTEEDWIQYKKKLNKPKGELNEERGPGWSKENYLLHGTILGKKYCNKTDYGSWDKEFTLDQLDLFIQQFYQKLRKGGTLIIWSDLWKVSYLKEMMEKHKFKQIRFIEWLKTNPQPINSKVNYLTNSRYPIAAGKYKIHPTQKNLQMFEEIIRKHSNENDLVLDTFLGGGTTAFACKNTRRRFKGCEMNKEYVNKVKKLLTHEVNLGQRS